VNDARRPRILLVDDSEPVRDAYTLLLEESGYQVEAVGDGHRALAAAAGSIPDAMILDLGLPGLDGLQVIRTLKADPATAGIPIITLTGRDDPQARISCEDAGSAAFLIKPIPTQQLLRVLAEQLRP
jgi:CheY-like chemotaxis protein